jgi:hypothetical protein
MVKKMKNLQQQVVCFACSKQFKKRLSEIKVSARHFCSRLCFQKTWATDPKPHIPALRIACCHPKQPHRAKGLCAVCYAAAYTKANPEIRRAASRLYAKRHPERLRDSQLRLQYGITLKEFKAKYKAQRGLCAICHTRDAVTVDHCHANKIVRDLLCKTCNQGIGLLRECPSIVYNAAEYLEKWEVRTQYLNDQTTDPEVS